MHTLCAMRNFKSAPQPAPCRATPLDGIPDSDARTNRDPTPVLHGGYLGRKVTWLQLASQCPGNSNARVDTGLGIPFSDILVVGRQLPALSKAHRALPQVIADDYGTI